MINTREVAAEYRLAHWTQVMKDQKESGMSVRAYSKAAGFHENRYYYWQRKLRETACTELTAMNATDGEKAIVPSGWSVCETADDKQKPSIVVEVGSFKISVDESFEPELLTKVCKALIPLC